MPSSGSGGLPGRAPSKRAGRLEELVSIVRRLGAGETVTEQGRHFDLDAVSMEPLPVQPSGVPILMACHWRAGKEAQFKRAARLGDGFISISDTPEEYARVVEKVRMYAGEEGRDFDQMESVFYMTVNLKQDRAAAVEDAEKYLLAVLRGQHLGRPVGSLRTSRRDRQTHRGVRQQPAPGPSSSGSPPFDQEAQLDTFLSEVVPEFQ